MNGGDLRFHISRKTFTEEAVRFWIAELGCALRYIHEQGIIHRDVKPDNVLLDSEGHIHLADFVSQFPAILKESFTNFHQNVASDYVGKALTSKSGTLAYLSPEVYAGTGYGPGADWWSLGVLFYECIYNRVRFVTILILPTLTHLFCSGLSREVHKVHCLHQSRKPLRPFLSQHPQSPCHVCTLSVQRWKRTRKNVWVR